MTKIDEQLRQTINPSFDVTEPPPGMVGSPEDAWDLIEAAGKLNSKGLIGVLDDLAVECLEFLTAKGLNVKPPGKENDVPVISQDELIRIAQIDPISNEIAALLMGIFNLRRYVFENGPLDAETESFAFRAFLVGAAAESAKLRTVRKYAATGIKALSGLKIANETKAAEAEQTIEVVKERMRSLIASGVEDHNVVSMYVRKYGDHYSDRHLRRIKSDL